MRRLAAVLSMFCILADIRASWAVYKGDFLRESMAKLPPRPLQIRNPYVCALSVRRVRYTEASQRCVNGHMRRLAAVLQRILTFLHVHRDPLELRSV